MCSLSALLYACVCGCEKKIPASAGRKKIRTALYSTLIFLRAGLLCFQIFRISGNSRALYFKVALLKIGVRYAVTSATFPRLGMLYSMCLQNPLFQRITAFHFHKILRVVFLISRF